MSIEDIELSLPNGLHDAILRKHIVDYENKTLELDVDIWVGDLNSEIEEEREHYKSGTLRFEGLEYFVIEPPLDVKTCIEPFSFSAGNPEEHNIKPSVGLPLPPDGAFRVYIFIYKLEAFMHICASRIEFEYGT